LYIFFATFVVIYHNISYNSSINIFLLILNIINLQVSILLSCSDCYRVKKVADRGNRDTYEVIIIKVKKFKIEIQ